MVGMTKLKRSIAPVAVLIVPILSKRLELLSANVADALKVVSDDWASAPVTTRKKAQAKTIKLDFTPTVKERDTLVLCAALRLGVNRFIKDILAGRGGA